ncbi:hypothetical protein NNO_2070 [Hydrogenimonas sp.]|nr:hypothetical protein NNO_2070 [Hydrogenimonas sp.]
MSGHYLIAYDVRSSKRRRRCAKVAYSYALGGQKSALESLLEPKELPVVLDELLDSIDPEEDRVHLVHVMPKAILLGRAKQINYENGAILI